jgi:hypothetical protein
VGGDGVSEECDMHDWFVWGGVDIHSIDNYENEFEAIVNVTVKCSLCGKIQELVMCAKDEVTE